MKSPACTLDIESASCYSANAEAGPLQRRIAPVLLTPMMIRTAHPMPQPFLITVKVTVAIEAVVVVSVLSEILEQGRTCREVGAMRVVVAAGLQVADVVAAGVGDVSALGCGIHELTVAALAVVVGGTVGGGVGGWRYGL
jgi:hypothetical protein